MNLKQFRDYILYLIALFLLVIFVIFISACTTSEKPSGTFDTGEVTTPPYGCTEMRKREDGADC